MYLGVTCCNYILQIVLYYFLWWRNKLTHSLTHTLIDLIINLWDRSDYLHEVSRQLQDQSIYEDIKFNENILTDLVAKSNKIFTRLCSHKFISAKELKYFTNNFKKATNLGKLYILKIHNRLSAVPSRPVISNRHTPTTKVSEYLDYILKPTMQDSCSYIRDFGDFLKEIKNIGKIPEGAILVTVDVVGLYPSMSHETGLEALRKRMRK